jgi:2-polyprenyl-3-methyl-5-hydroxy-6-metoxy-1,4-benzoquinol methylase
MKEKNFEYTPELYDLQMNWPQRLSKEKDFFEKIIKERKVKKILEIGGGIGRHAQMFSEMADSVTFMEPSEDMLQYAKANILKSGSVKAVNGGFEDLDRLVFENFGMITCLGNTLPILENRKNVKMALKQTSKKLTKGGIAIFQFLNFEPKIMEQNRFYAPRIFKKEDKKYIFLKHFESEKVKTRVDFMIIEMDPEDNIVNFHNRSTFLCTLRKNLFLKMAYNSGFKKVELLGTGGTEEFDKNRHISLYALLYN